MHVITSDRFAKIIEDQFARCKDTLCLKAIEYANGQEDDRLHNFRCAAGMMNCGMKEALAGMMAKHTISIMDMCRSDKDYESYMWDEKITDHINYLLLLKAIVEEEQDKQKVAFGCNEGTCQVEYP